MVSLQGKVESSTKLDDKAIERNLKSSCGHSSKETNNHFF